MFISKSNFVRPASEARRAFTLVEILVVVAIIGMLAALLVPAYKGALRSSMAAKGTSNLRQLAIAQIQYAAENGGRYAEIYQTTNAVVWQTRLGPYLKIYTDDNAFWKEQRMNPRSVFNTPDSKPLAQRAAWETSIGMNPWMQSALWNFRATIISNPAGTILLGEMPVEINGDGTWPPDWGARAYTSFNRGGRTNMLMAFCDGHVQALGVPALCDGTASRPAGQSNLWHWFYQPGMGQAVWQ